MPVEVRLTLPDVDQLEMHKHKPAGAKHKMCYICTVNVLQYVLLLYKHFIPVYIDECYPWFIVWIDPIKPQ